jgi:aspartyl-tRNA(Asn)/glutamyl-tRNA(Gln) amidotransferase subunit A
MTSRSGDVDASDAAGLSVAQARRLLEAGKLSCFELVSSVINRLESTEPTYHAYVATRLDDALKESRAIDRTYRTGGHEADGRDGVLRGIPFAAKDVFCTTDLPTEAGSKVLKGHRPGMDAAVVAHCRDAGGILLGKLVTHEFACGQDVPETRNAWNPAHYPGGSTAGGGVAVALGSTMAAFGSDSAGSVRKPAALNGVVGYKPTFRALSTDGVIPLSPSCDHVGILARTVEDCALLASAAAGERYGGRPRWLEPVDGDATTIRGMRLGLADYYQGPHVNSSVQKVFEKALQAVRDLGAEIVDVSLDRLSDSIAAGFTIIMAEAAAVHTHWLRTSRSDYHPGTRRFLELASLLPAQHVEWARIARRALTAQVADTFRLARLDALVMPTVPMTSMPLASMDIARDLPEYIRHTLPANLVGQPAVTVPCGLTDTELPVGLQFAGRPWQDSAVLAMATAYESATEWWLESLTQLKQKTQGLMKGSDGT